jgi:E3 ubiquitin-protein ligase HUWE1
LEELKQIDAWTFGKCELFHWIDVLDISDSILEEAATRSSHNPWELACDLPQNREVCLINDLFFKNKLITKCLLLYFTVFVISYIIYCIID